MYPSRAYEGCKATAKDGSSRLRSKTPQGPSRSTNPYLRRMGCSYYQRPLDFRLVVKEPGSRGFTGATNGHREPAIPYQVSPSGFPGFCQFTCQEMLRIEQGKVLSCLTKNVSVHHTRVHRDTASTQNVRLLRNAGTKREQPPSPWSCRSLCTIVYRIRVRRRHSKSNRALG